MMTEAEQIWLWFWTAMIFASIAWYALLLVFIGYGGGRDILEMTRALAQAASRAEKDKQQP